MANALPVCFWQFLQWHKDLRSGSGPSVVTLSCPQLHDALRVVTSPSRVNTAAEEAPLELLESSVLMELPPLNVTRLLAPL
jgi:hypothetical protein